MSQEVERPAESPLIATRAAHETTLAAGKNGAHPADAWPATLPAPDPPKPAFHATQAASTSLPTSSGRRSALAQSLPTVDRARYAIGEEVAKGGIGRVMRARDERLGRSVAIKELLSRNEASEQRFVREALLTARLQHPAIVPIYEAGRWEDGEPFYAMKLLSGRSLADLIAEQRTLAERLSLLPHVLTAAQAVAYAHSQHILHRDLKPANVLVGELGETVVIDWGLAKSVGEVAPASVRGGHGTNGAAIVADDENSGDSGLTIAGAIVGTPAYMPPEQAAGKAVDERADVYALGAMLYHLFAAVPPYHDVSSERLLVTVGRAPPTPVERLVPTLAEELRAIVRKAMARDPADRYRSAKELADDLERYLSGQLVAAHNASVRYLLRRFWRKNRAIVSIVIGAIVSLALVVTFTLIYNEAQRRFAEQKAQEAESAGRRADEERRNAEIAGQRAQARADELTLLQAENAVQRDPNEAISWLTSLSGSFADPRELRRIASDARAAGLSRVFSGHALHVNDGAVFADGTRYATASDDKTVRIWDLATGESSVLRGARGELWRVAISPDGARVAAAGMEGVVRAWSPDTGAIIGEAETGLPVGRLGARRDGWFVGVSGSDRAWEWDGTSAAIHAIFTKDDQVVQAQWSADGARALAITLAGDVLQWEPGREKPERVASDMKGRLMVSSTGKYALFQTLKDGQMVLRDVDAGRTYAGWPPRVKRLEPAFSPEDHLVALTDGNDVGVYSVPSGALIARLSGHVGEINVMAWSDDESTLVTGSYDRTVRAWDIRTGLSTEYRGLLRHVTDVQILPNDAGVIGAASDGGVRMFDPVDIARTLYTGSVPLRAVGVGANDDLVVTDTNGAILAFDALGRVLSEERPALGPLSVDASPDRARFAVAALPPVPNDAIEEIHGTSAMVGIGRFGGDPIVWLDAGSPVRSLAWSPKGDALFLGTEGGGVKRIDPETGSLADLPGRSFAVASLAVSADGTTLAAGFDDGTVALISAMHGAPGDRPQRGSKAEDPDDGDIRPLGKHDEPVVSLDFSTSGTWLASGSRDHTARIWRASDGSHHVLEASGTGVISLHFSRDERTLYTRSGGETIVRCWDVTTGEAQGPLQGHRGPIAGTAFFEPGGALLTWSADRTLRWFDLQSGRSRALRGHTEAVANAAFLSGGNAMISVGMDGTIRRWEDDLPANLEDLKTWVQTMATEHAPPPMP